MEEKAKYIIIGLIVILAVSLFLNFQTYTFKNAIERERNQLRDENISLNKKIEQILKDKQGLDERVNLLTGDLNKISQQKDELQKQKDELQKQYDSLVKERNELVESLKTPTSAAKPESTSGMQNEAYWAGVLRSKADLELQLENMRSELQAAQIGNAQLQRDKTNLELELSSLMRSKQDLEQQLRMLDSMTFELVREKNEKFKLQDDVKSIRNENMLLKRQLKSLRNYKANLENRLKRLQEEKTGLERKFTEMEFLLENRLSQVSDLKQQLDNIRRGGKAELLPPKEESVTLPPIVVKPEAENAVTPQQDETGESLAIAKVLTVNKENNFVIIDVGEEAGIKIGETFQVYRQDKLIADIEVIQVRKSVAACDIRKIIVPIKIGDIIK